jgi:hypothetical protein
VQPRAERLRPRSVGHEAVRHYRASLELFCELGDARMDEPSPEQPRQPLADALRRPRRALPLLDASLTLQRRVGDVALATHALYVLAQVHEDLGDRPAAHARYRECIELCRKAASAGL